MTKSWPPMLGYNNNVRYRGRMFHIQTEDSGSRYARVMTHLFVDGGQIVKSTKTEYAEALGRTDFAETVRQLMKEQHKAMFLALRAGEYDSTIERIVGPLEPAVTPLPESVEPRTQRQGDVSGGAEALAHKSSPFASGVARDREDALASLVPQSSGRHKGPAVEAKSQPSASPIGEPPPSEGKRAALLRATTLPPVEKKVGQSTRPRKPRSSLPPQAATTRLVDDPTPVDILPPTTKKGQGRSSERTQRVVQRPITKGGEILDPSHRSIFGAPGDATKTLDEVILSFLEEEEK